jgi:hypothetical protein
MTLKAKNNKSMPGKRNGNIKVIKNMRSYESDPVFLKKKEEAYKALNELPLPKEIARRIQKN